MSKYLCDTVDLSKVKDRKERFRIFSSLAMKNYMMNGKWSREELLLKGILERIGLQEKVHYWHNWKLHNREQTGYFELDFFIPRLRLVIEVDGEIWHRIDNSQEKDSRRDRWLREIGYTVVRISTRDIRERLNEVELFLRRLVEERSSAIHQMSTVWCREEVQSSR